MENLEMKDGCDTGIMEVMEMGNMTEAYANSYPDMNYQYNFSDSAYYPAYDCEIKLSDGIYGNKLSGEIAFKVMYNNIVEKFVSRWGSKIWAVNEHIKINYPIGEYNDVNDSKIRTYGTWLNKLNALKKRIINENWTFNDISDVLDNNR